VRVTVSSNSRKGSELMRSKACNNIMTPTEIIWYDDTGDFEEFCLRCRQLHFESEFQDMQPLHLTPEQIEDLED